MDAMNTNINEDLNIHIINIRRMSHHQNQNNTTTTKPLLQHHHSTVSNANTSCNKSIATQTQDCCNATLSPNTPSKTKQPKLLSRMHVVT
jgi:hypothetical protein